MTDSYRAELREIIEHVYLDDLGGRATTGMVHAGVVGVLPEHLVDYLIGKGIASEVQSYFRAKGKDGLPKYPQVNDDGEHAQLSLLSRDEYRFLYGEYINRADANIAQAERVRGLCLKAHAFDLAESAVGA